MIRSCCALMCWFKEHRSMIYYAPLSGGVQMDEFSIQGLVCIGMLNPPKIPVAIEVSM